VSGLLLDTHALLWALTEPDKIPADTLATVRDRTVAVYVSAASAWEIGTKHRLGRLPDAAEVVERYHDHLTRLNVVELDITGRHALEAGRLDWAHRDPFDRMLVAQAAAEGLTIVTADEAITHFDHVRTLW
jgi:PIN domain nuclease of toxin-antitoxin system